MIVQTITIMEGRKAARVRGEEVSTDRSTHCLIGYAALVDLHSGASTPP